MMPMSTGGAPYFENRKYASHIITLAHTNSVLNESLSLFVKTSLSLKSS
jgi:hypothetical protein